MMKSRTLKFLALFFLMLITGVFWGTWFTLTRSIEQFSPDEFIHIGKVIIANVAMPMRIIMPAGILLTLAAVWKHRSERSSGFYLGLTSLVLIVAVLLITLIVLVPIDNDIKGWSSTSLPNNWEEIRNTWQAFHSLRTFLSIASFACFAVFVVTDHPPAVT